MKRKKVFPLSVKPREDLTCTKDPLFLVLIPKPHCTLERVHFWLLVTSRTQTILVLFFNLSEIRYIFCTASA